MASTARVPSHRLTPPLRRRRPDPRRIKINRAYTVEEAAYALRVHKNTVREWIKRGLSTISDRRPLLILGRELRLYLETRRGAGKRPCSLDELYCVRCRSPKRPAGDMADCVDINATNGNLKGLCPDCGSWINRRVSIAKLSAICPDLDIGFPEGQRPLRDST